MPLKRPDYEYRHPSRSETEAGLIPPSKAALPLGQLEPSAEHVVSYGRTDNPKKPRGTMAGGAERCRMDIAFAVPAHGGLRIYKDMLKGGVPARTAILAIGTRALRVYETVHPQLDHEALFERFGASSFEVPTRRTVDPVVRTHAWQALDPYDVRSDRDVGRRLGRVVIQHWIETDQKLVS